jgi:hypothetical protein
MINVEGMGQSLAPGLADRQDRGTIPYTTVNPGYTPNTYVFLFIQ